MQYAKACWSFLFSSLALAACQTTSQPSFSELLMKRVGQPVSNYALDYGPPSAEFDIEAGL
jgi:hypothetical protein